MVTVDDQCHRFCLLLWERQRDPAGNSLLSSGTEDRHDLREHSNLCSGTILASASELSFAQARWITARFEYVTGSPKPDFLYQKCSNISSEDVGRMTQHQCRMSKYCILGPVMESQ